MHHIMINVRRSVEVILLEVQNVKEPVKSTEISTVKKIFFVLYMYVYLCVLTCGTPPQPRKFSNFVKSGMEAYVLGESRMNGQPGEKHEVIISGPLVQWRPIQQYYTCTVDKPKKETKLKGLKSFIAYSLTSTLSRIQVILKNIDFVYHCANVVNSLETDASSSHWLFLEKALCLSGVLRYETTGQGWLCVEWIIFDTTPV
ncbi:unnamed protein product [Haemonchus placei]|uniref:CST complex subunit CTC1 n=1 Tax=Haemonchus placei TaxID=6290 RepID=A0A0N4VXS3_HAEPC|nr:unnamed protein product [Haemonchus placei]